MNPISESDESEEKISDKRSSRSNENKYPSTESSNRAAFGVTDSSKYFIWLMVKF
jgi:hypothetical protein